ncbi:hypothetical protein A3K86_22025 [Photobacterium jeanii]|uniref:OmpA-like domain-containing protein n=1 Tax=Photobacterium jeanii TaxID=858640 RepID=A0A178K2Q8_9GAMM|nr:OmpA family protein [Photobacterium jeanii]OAN11598.1 hypothetical protein A3K86_22025 [Photobacterium jeanii]PST91119.1 OmpA family protein [Photobacterium jeanii]
MRLATALYHFLLINLTSLLLLGCSAAQQGSVETVTNRSEVPSPEAKVLLTTIAEHRDVIYFEKNSYELSTQAQLLIDPIAVRLLRYPDTHVIIIGHSDNEGSAEDNVVLSYERAFSVAIYITSVFGIEEERLQLIAAGEDEPVIHGSATLEQQQNRRVEIISPKAVVRTLNTIDGQQF